MRTTVVAFVCVFAVSLPRAEAGTFWSSELTYQASATGDRNLNGVADCPADSADGQWTPGRPRGGWFEWRFMDNPDTNLARNIFQSLPAAGTDSGDVTRRCPTTFNEFTTGHLHGVLSGRLALYNGALFGVYDSIGGYYWENTIKLQQNPSNTAVATPSAQANLNRPYTVIELARNPRHYISVNPSSIWFQTRFDNADYVYTPELDGCDHYDGMSMLDSDGVKDGRFNGWKFDPLWAKHAGNDHELTFCAPPAATQTFDPDIVINATKTYVTWAERYVEGKYIDPVTGAVTMGFDSAVSIDASIFPYNRLGIHVEAIDTTSLLGGTPDSTYSRRTPLTSGEAGLKVNAGMDVVAPRVTAVTTSGVVKPVVAWAETAFTFLPGESDYANITGLTKTQAFGPPTGAQGAIRVKTFDGSVWTDVGSSPGNACNFQSVSSGRASGRRRVFTGSHDIATIKDSAGHEQPILVSSQVIAGRCGLAVKQFDGATWQSLGGDLSVNSDRSPAWSRILVEDNVPYIVWVERAAAGVTTAHDYVYVKRWNGSAWDNLGNSAGRWWPATSAATADPIHLMGASIAVMSQPPSSSDSASGLVPAILGKTITVAMVSQATTAQTADVISTTCNASPFLSAGACWGDPKLASSPAKAVGQYDPPLYQNTQRLGVAWGQRVLGSMSTGIQTHEDYSADFNDSKPGATDLVSSSLDPLSGPLTVASRLIRRATPGRVVYASWTGPAQNHREFDQGLYAKAQYAAPHVTYGIGPDVSILRTPGSAAFTSFGSNGNGQLGGTSNTMSALPYTNVTLPEVITKTAVGALMAGALGASGTLFMWGRNDYGTLCTGDTTPRATPTQVAGTNKFVDFALGYAHVIALRDDGTVWTCGFGSYGQLGNGQTANSSTWQQVRLGATNGAFVTDAIGVIAGGFHNCIVRADAKASCFGYNYDGELGSGDFTTSAPYGRSYALPVSGNRVVKQLVTGYYHNALIAEDGGYYAWGYNGYGQLAVGDTVNRNVPTFNRLPSLEALAGGAFDTYMLSSAHDLYGAGGNWAGQLQGASPNGTTAIAYLQSFVESVTAGSLASHVYVTTSRDVYHEQTSTSCFGYNASGQCDRPGYLSFGPFTNNQQLTLATLGRAGEGIGFTLTYNVENNYDFVMVSDAWNHYYQLTGNNATSFSGLVGPVVVSFSSDYSVTSTSVVISDVIYPTSL